MSAIMNWLTCGDFLKYVVPLVLFQLSILLLFLQLVRYFRTCIFRKHVVCSIANYVNIDATKKIHGSPQK